MKIRVICVSAVRYLGDLTITRHLARGGPPLRPVGIGTPADLHQPYHGERGRLSAGQLPLARPFCSDVLDRPLSMQTLQDRAGLFGDPRSQDPVGTIEPLRVDDLAGYIVGAERFVCGGSENVKAKPPQLVAGKVAGSPMATLRANGFRVDIGGENAENAVDMRQVRSMLIELTL